jgi:hypothetical protein
MPQRRTLVILSLCLLATGFYFSLKLKPPNSFSAMISSKLDPLPRWSISSPSPEEDKNLHAILSQKFTFLGEGVEAIAFQSSDGKYILKFFKMDRLTPSFKDQLYPSAACQRLKNLRRVFDGYKNGFEDLRHETGLIWIHLAKTTNFNQIIIVIDPHGKEHLINADSTEFVIQEKAELMVDRLSRLYKEGKIFEAEQALASFYAFIQHRTERGYLDRDKTVIYNYGFVGDRPIQIDLGRLHKRKNKKERPKEIPVERAKARIERWKLQKGIPLS